MAASPLDEPLPATDHGAPCIEILRSLEQGEPIWRSLEAKAVMAPYGRYDWVSAFQRNQPDEQRTAYIALQRGSGGEVDLLMPLQLCRHLGLTIATAIGGKHANYNLPLQGPDLARRLTEQSARCFLEAAGRAMGADLLRVLNVPVLWEGQPNPFAAGGIPASSKAYSLRLEADADKTLGRSMSGEARKKARSKARGLAALGHLHTLHAQTEQDVERILGAFYHQKEQRLSQRGVDDPFSDPLLQRFMHEAATFRLAEGKPAIELYGLLLNDDVIAVLGGASDGRRFSGMFVSFKEGDTGRFSPGEMLIIDVIRDLCRRGFAVFDLGAGDARYKRGICDETEALVELFVPLTLPGRAYALAQTGILGAKRRIRSDATAMALVGKMRRLKSSLLG